MTIAKLIFDAASPGVAHSTEDPGMMLIGTVLDDSVRTITLPVSLGGRTARVVRVSSRGCPACGSEHVTLVTNEPAPGSGVVAAMHRTCVRDIAWLRVPESGS